MSLLPSWQPSTGIGWKKLLHIAVLSYKPLGFFFMGFLSAQLQCGDIFLYKIALSSHLLLALQLALDVGSGQADQLQPDNTFLWRFALFEHLW